MMFHSRAISGLNGSKKLQVLYFSNEPIRLGGENWYIILRTPKWYHFAPGYQLKLGSSLHQFLINIILLTRLVKWKFGPRPGCFNIYGLRCRRIDCGSNLRLRILAYSYRGERDKRRAKLGITRSGHSWPNRATTPLHAPFLLYEKF